MEFVWKSRPEPKTVKFDELDVGDMFRLGRLKHLCIKVAGSNFFSFVDNVLRSASYMPDLDMYRVDGRLEWWDA